MLDVDNVGGEAALDDLRVEDWDEMIDISIKGVLYGIAAALPVFRKQGIGHLAQRAPAGMQTLACRLMPDRLAQRGPAGTAGL